jgi:hypothetical protein
VVRDSRLRSVASEDEAQLHLVLQMQWHCGRTAESSLWWIGKARRSFESNDFNLLSPNKGLT